MQPDMFNQIDDYVLVHIFSYVNDFISKVRMSNTCKRFGMLKKNITEIKETDKVKNYELVSHYNITTVYYDILLGSRKIDESGRTISGYYNVVIPFNVKDVDIIEYPNSAENKLVFDKLHFRKGYIEKKGNCIFHYGDNFTVTGTLKIFKK